MELLCPQGDTFSEDAINFFYNLSMDTELKMNVIKTDGKRDRSSSLSCIPCSLYLFLVIESRLV